MTTIILAEQLRCLNCLQQKQAKEQREQARFGYCQSECQPQKINEDKDVERSTFVRFELVGKTMQYAIKRASMLSQVCFCVYKDFLNSWTSI